MAAKTHDTRDISRRGMIRDHRITPATFIHSYTGTSLWLQCAWLLDFAHPQFRKDFPGGAALILWACLN